MAVSLTVTSGHDGGHDGGDRPEREQQPPACLGSLARGLLGGDPLAGALAACGTWRMAGRLALEALGTAACHLFLLSVCAAKGRSGYTY